MTFYACVHLLPACFCAQVLYMSHVMKIIVTAVNLIKNNGLKHRHFQQYLIELESEYSNLLYYVKVCWLSPVSCLERLLWTIRCSVNILL